MVRKFNSNLGELAFRAGRHIGKHPISGWLFCLTERVLPLKRIARDSGLVAFHHPRPIADPHVLIVPTRPVSSLTTSRMDDGAMASLLWSMIGLAQTLTSQLPESEAWNLIINGGTRQDIGQLHGHLIHATANGRDHLAVISNPETNPTNWQDTLDTLRSASLVPDNGFSLIFSWNSGGLISASVTQSAGA